MEHTGSRSDLQTYQTMAEYQIALYHPVLDTIISELKRRFTSTNFAIMKGIQACHPKSYNFFYLSSMRELIEHYKIDYVCIERETHVAKRTLAKIPEMRVDQ